MKLDEKFDEKFEQLYSKMVTEHSQDLESLRKDARNVVIRNNLVEISFFLLLSIGIVLYFSLYELISNINIVNLIGLIYFITAVIVFIILHIKFNPNRSVGDSVKSTYYNEMYKSTIVNAILESFNEDIKYSPSIGIRSAVYDDAEFEKYELYDSEDLIQGTLKNNSYISMAEVSTKYSRTSEEGKTEYYDIFCGFFSKVKTQKPFSTNLYLRKDINDKNLLNRFISAKPPFDNLRVELDSGEFERMFDVYCSDTICAMQLLTADVLQLLLDFQKELGIDYELTIKNNSIYIRFLSGKMFEASGLSKYSLDKLTIYVYYKMIEFTIS